MENVNLTEFGDTLESSLDLDVGLGICQINSNLLTVFNQTVETITDFMAPIKKCNKLIRECDFFDSELILMKRKRRKLERMYRKKKIVFDDFKEFDREMRSFAAKKREFFRKKIEVIQTDSKIFRALDKLIGNKTEAVLPFHKCKVTLANNFNDYFAGKVSKLCTETLSMDMLENSFKATPVVLMESFSYIKLEDLHQAVLSMSNATAPHDLIRTVIFKKLWSYWGPHILKILKLYNEMGKFPDELKEAVIIPTLKKENLDPEQLSSYRPISNLVFLSKLFEKRIHIQLVERVMVSGLLDNNQSAYIFGASTETALLKTSNDICKFLDMNNYLILIGLDLSSAFDTLRHDYLIGILKNYIGLSDNILKWFRSYLSNRRQKVFIDSHYSDEVNIEHGVPQGSILGPLLFCIYILPLRDVFLKLNVSYQSYADDTLFYVAANFKENDFISVKEKVHSIIINVLDCYKKLGLVVNPDKTEIISLAKPNHKLDLKSFFVGSYEVRVLNELKSLGVFIDKNWNAVPHINKVTQTCYFVLRKLYSVGYYLDFNNRVILVKNLILSRLDYCNSLFLGLPDKLIKKLQ